MRAIGRLNKRPMRRTRSDIAGRVVIRDIFPLFIAMSRVIFLRHKETTATVLDRFRNAAVLRRRHWQTGCHCFEKRVRYSFLVLVR